MHINFFSVHLAQQKRHSRNVYTHNVPYFGNDTPASFAEMSRQRIKKGKKRVSRYFVYVFTEFRVEPFIYIQCCIWF